MQQPHESGFKWLGHEQRHQHVPNVLQMQQPHESGFKWLGHEQRHRHDQHVHLQQQAQNHQNERLQSGDHQQDKESEATWLHHRYRVIGYKYNPNRGG